MVYSCVWLSRKPNIASVGGQTWSHAKHILWIPWSNKRIIWVEVYTDYQHWEDSLQVPGRSLWLQKHSVGQAKWLIIIELLQRSHWVWTQNTLQQLTKVNYGSRLAYLRGGDQECQNSFSWTLWYSVDNTGGKAGNDLCKTISVGNRLCWGEKSRARCLMSGKEWWVKRKARA